MTFLASLFAGTLGATQGEGENATARYASCALAGASVNNTCPSIGDETTGETLFDIGVATAVVNAGLFVLSVISHWGYGAFVWNMRGQVLASLLNIGLFAGLVGHLNSVEDILLDDNVEYSVFFTGANPYMVAVFGLVFGVADIVIFNALNMLYFKGDCNPGTDTK